MVDEMNEAEKAGKIIEWDADGRPVVPEIPSFPISRVTGRDRISGLLLSPCLTWQSIMPMGENALFSGMNCWLERRLKGSTGQTTPCPSRPLRISPGMGSPSKAP